MIEIDAPDSDAGARDLPFEEWTETFGTERLMGALLLGQTRRYDKSIRDPSSARKWESVAICSFCLRSPMKLPIE
ncbi:hypothetical protein [Roseobacter fucihabitans]|uniref:hypothetical protein n=1 Tax=Roseobacter fucihabitans TaxID=1537242 RepID=UPI001652D4BE|nr:hypothetical protein [Roseobacter litoralis]